MLDTTRTTTMRFKLKRDPSHYPAHALTLIELLVPHYGAQPNEFVRRDGKRELVPDLIIDFEDLRRQCPVIVGVQILVEAKYFIITFKLGHQTDAECGVGDTKTKRKLWAILQALTSRQWYAQLILPTADYPLLISCYYAKRPQKRKKEPAPESSE